MDSSDSEDFIPGRTPKPTTAEKYAEKHGDSRVSLLDVMTKVKPHSPTIQALEERAARDMGTKKDDAEMRTFTEEDYLAVRDSAFRLPVTAAARRHEAEVASRDDRAARRAARHSGPEPAITTVADAGNGSRRRSTRHATGISYAESSPTTGPVHSSSPGFESPESEAYSPEPRGTKRKRTTGKDKDEEATTGAGPRGTKSVKEDSDDEMEDAASSSRSPTPAPPIKERSKKVTVVADSDDEMTDVPVSRKSSSRERSVTPAPPVKKRKVEGKRKTVVEDSDDEME